MESCEFCLSFHVPPPDLLLLSLLFTSYSCLVKLHDSIHAFALVPVASPSSGVRLRTGRIRKTKPVRFFFTPHPSSATGLFILFVYCSICTMQVSQVEIGCPFFSNFPSKVSAGPQRASSMKLALDASSSRQPGCCRPQKCGSGSPSSTERVPCGCGPKRRSGSRGKGSNSRQIHLTKARGESK